ncbi:Sulfotransferase family protein [Rubritalea squalenifaciens DSM 18772]|uniref:Sulfotransferase family protein n=2 Tax=Rubritalea squalenifaciens TaxID=407226 RepID=A0A1M6PMA4_9BACT|nr:Sulfotransferase family protein [Rubritalea squalenifaciens DSM 18772]
MIYQECADLLNARVAVASDAGQAMRLYEKAVRSNPKNVLVLQEAGAYFAEHHELSKSHACIERLIKLGKGQDARILLLAGLMWRQAYRPERALSCLREASQMPQASPKVYLELADLLERASQYEEAHEAVERCLAVDEKSGVAKELKARILHACGEKEESFRLLHACLNQDGVPKVELAKILNTWARMLDSEGAYNEAFDKLLQSKELLRNAGGVGSMDRANQVENARLSAMVVGVNSSHVESWLSEAEEGQTRQVLLTGAPRSGTTLIERFLDSHEEVVAVDEYNALTGRIIPSAMRKGFQSTGGIDIGVVDGIDRRERKMSAKLYLKLMEAYLGGRVGDKYLLDKNPGLTGHLPAILRMMPNMKILYALRNPMDVVVSSFFSWFPGNRMSVEYFTLESTVKRVSLELEFWLKLRGVLPTALWRETRYEDTVGDVEKEVDGIFDWLGVTGRGAERERKGQVYVNSPTYREASKPIYTSSQDRWKNYEKHLHELAGNLQSRCDQLGYSI